MALWLIGQTSLSYKIPRSAIGTLWVLSFQMTIQIDCHPRWIVLYMGWDDRVAHHYMTSRVGLLSHRVIIAKCQMMMQCESTNSQESESSSSSFNHILKLLYTVLRTVFHDDIYLDPFCDPMLSIPLAYGWTHMNYSQNPTLGWNETLFSVRHFGPHATSHPCITQKRQWVAASVSISTTSHSPTCLCKSCPA